MLPSLFVEMLLLAAVALLLISLPSYEARKILQKPMKRNQDQVPPTFVPVPSPLSQKAIVGDQINVSSLLGGLDWAPHVPVPPSAPSPGTYIPSSAMRQTNNPPHPSMLHNAYHVSPPNPLSQKALASDQINVSSLLGGLDWAPRVPVPPSAPSPGTYIPNSAMRQTKNPPHPSMLHNAYHVSPPNPLSQKASASDQINVSSLLGGLDWAPRVPVPPSAPSPGTYIPSSAIRQTNNPPHPSTLHNAYHVSPPNPSTRVIPPSTTTSQNTAPLLGTPQMSPLPLSVNTAPLLQKSPLPPSVNTAPLPQKSPLPPSVDTAPLLGTPQKSPLPPFVSNRGTSIP